MMTGSLPPLSGFAQLAPGEVWLVGAGPGDPGLLTLLGLSALQQADVVVHDALLGTEILDWVREGAEVVYAGKRGGTASPKQVDISAQLITLAKAGKRVVRLKGGDPLVFGRGGEEALALLEAGVRFRFVPGVSSGLGGLAYAGIPLTHRSTNSAVTFITGHSVTGDVPDNVDWAGLAISSPALVIFMAIKHLEPIMETLLKAGRPAEEPVAVIQNATMANMRVLETTVGQTAADVRAHNFGSPALIAIGANVALRGQLNWLGL